MWKKLLYFHLYKKQILSLRNYSLIFYDLSFYFSKVEGGRITPILNVASAPMNKDIEAPKL